MADSTSDDTNSSDAASGPAPGTANSISEEDQQYLGKLAKSLIRFLIDSKSETRLILH